MIPQNISCQHILQAIAEIREDGVPPHRESKGYDLIHEGRCYPPKYVISLANRYANGEEWPYARFLGGAEANAFLRAQGFIVRRRDGSGTP
jgi:5-methylcytosine-specific restriction protein A